MANVSDWKGFERMVAESLGGKRRLRTMESYGKKATDIYWPKALRREFPFLKNVMVECKKKKAVNVYTEMAIAKIKYADKEDSIVILATKRPAPGSWKKRKRILVKHAVDAGMRKRDAKKRVRRDMFIDALVTVDLDFFKELFRCWKEVTYAESIRRNQSDS